MYESFIEFFFNLTHRDNEWSMKTTATLILGPPPVIGPVPLEEPIDGTGSSQILGSTPPSSSSSRPSLIGDDAIDLTLLALSVQPGSDDNLSMSQAVSSSTSSDGTQHITEDRN